MSSFRDQLKKAKILSDKDAKRLAHEERVQRKKTSRKEAEAEEAQHRAELNKQQAQQREQDRSRQAERDADRQRREEVAACRMLVEQAAAPGRGTRFYFATPEGHVPFVEVDAQQLNGLTSRALRIVRPAAGAHVYRLVPRDQAERIAAALPDLVV